MERPRYLRHPMPRLLDGDYLRGLLNDCQATQEAIIRRDELLRANLHVNNAPLTSDTRIDDRHMNSIRRKPTRSFGKNNRAGPNVTCRYRVRQIDDLRSRIDRKNDSLHCANVS